MLNFLKKNKIITVLAPMSGRIVELKEIPDETFSQGKSGQGLAIEPMEGKVVAPFDGEITSIYKANHCLTVRSKEGVELLIHIGINTIELKGEGFTSHVQLMDKVEQGDLLIEVDLNYLKEQGKSTITPIVVTNMGRVEEIKRQSGIVEKAQDIIMEVKMKKSKY